MSATMRNWIRSGKDARPRGFRQRRPTTTVRFAALAALLTFAATGTAAEITASPRVWQIMPHETQDGEREPPADEACLVGTGWCLVVNQGRKLPQILQMEDIALTPAGVIALLVDDVDGTRTDVNGATTVDHPEDGSRVGGASQLGSGAPPHFEHASANATSTDDDGSASAFREPADASDAAGRLRQAVGNEAGLPLFAIMRSEGGGVTVEALTVRDRDVLVALRSPSRGPQSEQAIVLRLPQEALFLNDLTGVTANVLWLDRGLGIRDMSWTKDGLLLLVGSGVSGPTSLWLWDDADPLAEELGPLPDVTHAEMAETLLLISEDDDRYHVLVTFDGTENGRPREFIVQR